MRLVWICVFTVPLFAQMRVGNAMAGIRGPQPAARHSTPVPHRGNGYWGWACGYGVTAPSPVVLQSAPEVKAPILVSSPLYQADRAQPVMREYGSVLPELTSIDVALVAFRDGRVEPVPEAVRAYRQALALKPSASRVHFRLGSVLAAQDGVAGGTEHLREAAKNPALAQQAAEALRRIKAGR